jgi:hypothetical protein
LLGRFHGVYIDLAVTVIGPFIGSEQRTCLLLIFGPGLWIDTVANAGTLDGALDETSIFQLLQVLGNGRLGKPQFFDQVSVNTGFGLDQMLYDGDSGWMGQGLHHGSKTVLFVGEYFGFGQAHIIIVSLQCYD